MTSTSRREPILRSGDVRSASRARDSFVTAAIFWLLVGPRVNLINFAGSSVRLEDLVMASLGLVSIGSWLSTNRSKVGSTKIGLVIVATLASCVVGIISARINPAAGLLYALRPLEYWLTLPAVVLLLAGKNATDRLAWLVRMLAIITVLQVVAAALQYLGGFDIGFSKFSYERGAGLTAGPYELGAICALLACFWFARKNYALLVLSLAGITMSQSRTSIAGVIIAIVVLFVRERFFPARPWAGIAVVPPRPSQARRAASVVGVTLGVIALLLFSTPIVQQVVVPAASRVGSTSLITTWQQAGLLAQSQAPSETSQEYQTIAYVTIVSDVMQPNSAADASNLVRFYRWHLLLNAISNSGDYWFGLGPSFPGPSVDGAFLRIFVESGIFGLIAWYLFFLNWFRRTTFWFKAGALTLLVGSLFIDLPFALRPMVMLWILFAIARSERDRFGDQPNVLRD